MIMSAKYNEEGISGWTDGSEADEEAIRLASLLKRKSTFAALPELNYLHAKAETDHRKPPAHPHAPRRQDALRNTHHVLKATRERTDGHDQQRQASPHFKNEKIHKAVQLEEPRLTLSPYLTDPHLAAPHLAASHLAAPHLAAHRPSNLTDFQARTNCPLHLKNRESQASAFSNKLLSKMTPIKSHESIPRPAGRSESPQKSGSKHYVKLSTLQMVNDLRKQFRKDFLLKLGGKAGREGQAAGREQRNSSELGREAEISSRIKERFRQTFVKQDIFSKKRRRDGPDPSVADKQGLQAKMQSLRSPQKVRLIFK